MLVFRGVSFSGIFKQNPSERPGSTVTSLDSMAGLFSSHHNHITLTTRYRFLFTLKFTNVFLTYMIALLKTIMKLQNCWFVDVFPFPKENFRFQGAIFTFHASLQGCNWCSRWVDQDIPQQTSIKMRIQATNLRCQLIKSLRFHE